MTQVSDNVAKDKKASRALGSLSRDCTRVHTGPQLHGEEGSFPLNSREFANNPAKPSCLLRMTFSFTFL